jgi:hypothetical protein
MLRYVSCGVGKAALCAFQQRWGAIRLDGGRATYIGVMVR